MESGEKSEGWIGRSRSPHGVSPYGWG